LVRLFVAADLPEAVRAALPKGPDPPWRPVSRSSLHVTLAFLGEIASAMVPVVSGAVRKAVGEPGSVVGELRLLQTIALPPRRPRVLAVEIDDPAGSLAVLQERVADALVSAGVHEPERQPFLAHVTIGRARGPVGRPDVYLDVAPVAFAVPSVTVYRSITGKDGARYEALETVSLNSLDQ